MRTECTVSGSETVAPVSANVVVRPGTGTSCGDGTGRSSTISGATPLSFCSSSERTTTGDIVPDVMVPSTEYGRGCGGGGGGGGVRRQCALVALLSLTAAMMSATAVAGGDLPGAPAPAAFQCGTPPNQPFTGPKGVITTPRFPGPFPVPVECEWVIQADPAVADGGDTIIEVYFTQLFVTDGLTITEYSQYPVVFGFVTVREVFNKSHIHVGQSMLTTLPYLVIRFRLDRLEGNHIRVHDDLMDVYGFNITYEMRPAGNERNDVCSLYFCSYSGNCLGNADLT